MTHCSTGGFVAVVCAAGMPVQQHSPVAAPGGGGGGGGGTSVPRRQTLQQHRNRASNLACRGVRFQGDNWQARTKRSGKELSLGLYNSAEEAGMAYDLDRLHQQGGKAQRLNFPLLRQHYKQILSDLTDLHTPDGLLDFLALAVQAAVKAARNVPGATAPENTGPAAASMLNPRRTFPAAGQGAGMLHLPTSPPHLHTVAVGAATADWDLDDVRAVAVPAPADEHVMARQHAERLAMEHSLAAGLACSMAHIRLEAGSGCTWHMTCLACPATAAITQVSAVRALDGCSMARADSCVVTIAAWHHAAGCGAGHSAAARAAPGAGAGGPGCGQRPGCNCRF